MDVIGEAETLTMDIIGGGADTATAVVATLLLRLAAVAVSMATGHAGRLEPVEGDGSRAGAPFGTAGATHEATGVRAGLTSHASGMCSCQLETGNEGPSRYRQCRRQLPQSYHYQSHDLQVSLIILPITMTLLILSSHHYRV